MISGSAFPQRLIHDRSASGLEDDVARTKSGFSGR